MSYEKALEALADPTRRALFERIGKTPSSVGELADAFPISQPAVSQHLRVLREADLVQVRREGTRRIYGVSREGLGALRAYVESFWSDVLSAFADGASQSSEGAAQ
jgi:DNA-binding transcriptional ArsR family regulator